MVEEYFQSLKLWVKEIVPAAEFLYWSDFQIDARPYREGMKHLFGSGFCSIDANLMTRARSTAGKMGLRSDSVEYLIERVVEAIIIEEKYRPIKISCVARYKDDKVDLELPRLYLLPENLLAPWM